ncbi:hypothetical protein [Halomonas nitroreducens]|uniref:Uncharacterized protein n=1 Tax=Halomonas nitroreducens TaxID=447425 RepID=A0A3S0HSI5_9GAMM|nr:hypothetical protein [Halomonas nitroreducens]RTR01978.1 hypothetical protein EKG36_13295 [Halomonas nitroreducens]
MTTKPTHTHRTQGGRFTLVALHHGTGALDGQRLALYRDLDREVESVALEGEWRQHWREIEKDDCTLCMGTGTDQIKGNKRQPCGGCYGLGKVRPDGETPTDMWQLADIAGRIIQRQQTALQRLHSLEAMPEVQELVKRRQDEAVGRQEQQWRGGRGHGPNGQRRTGD